MTNLSFSNLEQTGCITSSEKLEMKKEKEDLWNMIKFLLTLSYGQVAVKRGFSVNEEVLAPNLQ